MLNNNTNYGIFLKKYYFIEENFAKSKLKFYNCKKIIIYIHYEKIFYHIDCRFVYSFFFGFMPKDVGQDKRCKVGGFVYIGVL